MAKRNYYLQCPYCTKRCTREDLVGHIEKHHMDELPEDFTPLRIVYHVANKRDFGNPRKCRVCGRPTEWDENKGRYNQLCGRPQCKEQQAKQMGKDMGTKIRANSPTQSTEGLEKMLAHRSISSTYMWSDGTVFVYTGSYEGKLLRWMDEIMNIKSEDLQVPGPTMVYDFDGEEHIYIPDLYYIPYNLIIEVKDGGSKPNTSEARRDSRRKTIAKERHIMKNTDYNYIRLTDNDFSQLLAVFADLKMHLIDDNKERVIHINEHMVCNTQGMMPPMGQNDIVLINYQPNHAFVGKSKFAISNNPQFSDLFGANREGKLKRLPLAYLSESIYTPYIVRNVKEKVNRFLEANINQMITDDQIYEMVFDCPRYSEDQILFEERAISYKDYYTTLIQESKKVRNSNGEYHK